MCGICGAVTNKSININEMLQTIHHRGPDYQGTHVDAEVHLGHARLSILDLSTSANQPMITSNGQFILIYNGEVYNFQTLKNELEQIGLVFKTHSDTEVILLGFQQWGIGLFEKLNGMFAFSIYDKIAQRLYVVRDRFGVKPLYYYHQNGDLLFGSEIKALLASNLIQKKMNYQGLHEYLHFMSTLGETTFYDGIHRLEPGTYIEFEIKTSAFAIKTYKLNYDLMPNNDSLEDAIRNIRTLLEKSVKNQLVADVPIGIFLSGGIDSTAVTAFASKHYDGKIKTFSAGFDFDKGVNELPNARFISEYYGTEHHEFHIKGGDIPAILETVNGYFDQPFADAANIPLYLMSKELKGNHKVILQGDGGDELFAGYPSYFRAKNEKAFRAFSYLITKLSFMVPKSSKYYRTMRSMYAILEKNPALISARMYSQEMVGTDPSRIFNPMYAKKIDATNPFIRQEQLHTRFKKMDLLQEMLYMDMNVILPDQYFEKVDRATMANSLEVRVPFIDNELATYAMSLPSSYKVRENEKKYLLKKALHGVVPDRILYGPKRGFGVPFHYWLKTSMKDFMFDSIGSTEMYNMPVIRQMMEDHVSGKEEHGFILWKILNLSLWLKREKGLSI